MHIIFNKNGTKIINADIYVVLLLAKNRNLRVFGV